MKILPRGFLLSFALMIICSTGCGPAGGGSPTVFTSPDGRVSITAPAGWENGTFKSTLGKIRISNKAQEGYGEVIIETKSDLKDGLTLSDYAKSVLRNVAVKLASASGNTENPIVSEPTPLTINGYPALHYQIKATVKNTKIVYDRTFIETPDFFVQVMLWTVPSRLGENQADFDSIAASLKQIK